MSVGCGILGFQTKAEVSSSMGYDARGWFCASLTQTVKISPFFSTAVVMVMVSFGPNSPNSVFE
jgi:hypothetical protein